jgi:hypothetical protein
MKFRVHENGFIDFMRIAQARRSTGRALHRTTPIRRGSAPIEADPLGPTPLHFARYL